MSRYMTRAERVGIIAGLILLAIALALDVDGWSPICSTEDSPSCIWFGPLQGNGQGPIIWNGPER